MCLTLHFYENIKRKAKEDIVCYKVVNADLRSLIYHYQYEIGEEYSNCKKLLSEKVYRNDPCGDSYVYDAFHSYADIITALYIARDYNRPFIEDPDVAILKCVIPKGSYYYMAKDFKQSYASDRIRVDEVYYKDTFMDPSFLKEKLALS